MLLTGFITLRKIKLNRGKWPAKAVSKLVGKLAADEVSLGTRQGGVTRVFVTPLAENTRALLRVASCENQSHSGKKPTSPEIAPECTPETLLFFFLFV